MRLFCRITTNGRGNSGNLVAKDINVNRLTLIAQLLGFSIALLRATLRVEPIKRTLLCGSQSPSRADLFALWHGRMFLPINAHRNESIATMASQSKDGNIIARWLKATVTS